MVSQERVRPTRKPLHPATMRLRDAMLTRGELENAHAEVLGLNIVDYRTIGVLIGQGNITPGELSAELGLSPSAASNVLERLEEAGHLTRERDPSDRRKVRLQVTDNAVHEVIANFAPLFDAVEAAVNGMPDDQQQAVVSYLDAVVTAMEDLISELKSRSNTTPQQKGA